MFYQTLFIIALLKVIELQLFPYISWQSLNVLLISDKYFFADLYFMVTLLYVITQFLHTFGFALETTCSHFPSQLPYKLNVCTIQEQLYYGLTATSSSLLCDGNLQAGEPDSCVVHTCKSYRQTYINVNYEQSSALIAISSQYAYSLHVPPVNYKPPL